VRSEPEPIECVHGHANVRQARFLSCGQVDGKASVGVDHIGDSKACKGQSQVRYHVALCFRLDLTGIGVGVEHGLGPD
jgi:hypothetical protein